MTTFEQLGLSPDTLRALAELGFVSPTPIQEQSIPKLLEADIDLLGLAQTGTGKTAAFALPILEKIDHKLNKPQALILCPTRELCLQITSDIEKFSQFYTNTRSVAVYGGASISMQIRDLRRGVQIIVATPGRMIDIIERGEVNFDHVKVLVLDEADEMLNMGFKESINQILSNTPDEKNTWLFTATMPKDIKQITKKYMRNPLEVSVSVNKGNDNIEHQYYLINPRDRYAVLKRIVDFNPDIFGIVFCRTKNETKDVADMLIRDGYNSDSLHGDLTQQQRDIVMKRYRERSLQLLIATDVAARGIDVSDVTHVINYALPDDAENYTHRSGRTARAGKKGISIALITKREMQRLYEVERMVEKKFEKINVPNGREVCEKQLLSLIHRAKEVEINEEEIAPFMDKVNLEFENLSKEEVIKRFASMEFNRFLDYYRDAHDLNLREDRGPRERGESGKFERGSREQNVRPRNESGGILPQSGYVRFFINAGSLDKLQKGDLLRLICDSSGVKGQSIGRIDMKDKFSFFEIESKFKMDIIKNLQGLELEGRSLRVDVASENGSSGFSSGPRSGPRFDKPQGERSSFGPRRDSGRSPGGRDRDRSFSDKRSDRGAPKSFAKKGPNSDLFKLDLKWDDNI